MHLNFESLINEINKTNEVFRLQAAKSVDKLLTLRNWLIGATIFEYEQNGEDRAKYGTKPEEKIAEKINAKGFSARNLKLFKQFYKTYPQIVQTLSALSENVELPIVQILSASLQTDSQSNSNQSLDPNKLIDHLSFSHFVELLKISDSTKREFYEIQIIQSALSTIGKIGN